MDVGVDSGNEQGNRDRSRRGDRNNRSRFSDNRDRSRDGSKGGRSECRRIYVSNVPYEYKWQDLKDLFRKEVGDVSFVELFSDENNKPRGCGIVEFEKAEHVQSALDKLNRFDINGRNLVIKEDFGNDRDRYGRVVPKNVGGGGGGGGDREMRGGGGGGGGGYRGGRDRDDDRISGGLGDYNNFETYGLSIKFLEGLGIQGPLHNKIFVANLDYKVDAKKLKQVFKMAGRIQNLDLSIDKDGNSRGFAVIEYDHPVEAVQAISMFDRQMLYERRMTVRLDRIPDKGEATRLPEGLKSIGIGLGPNGEPLKDVTRNLPSLQKCSSNQNQNVAPTPVAPPASILGPVPNATLSGLSSNLAAQLSSVVGLSNLGALPNSLLSNAAASLNSLGNLGQQLSQQQQQQEQNVGFNQNYSSNFGSGGGGGGGGANRNDFDANVRNYNTQPNDDYGRNYGGGGNIASNGANRKSSDTIVIRNMPVSWTWQTLRDKFRDVGEVKFAEIRGQDTGVVRFAQERDAEVAIKLMDGSRFEGRAVDVTYF